MSTTLVIILILVLSANLVALLAVLRRTKHLSPSPVTKPLVEVATPKDFKKLDKDSHEIFTEAVEKASKQFNQDLEDTNSRLNELILKLSTDVVDQEIEQYRTGLAQARASALATLAQMQVAVEEKQESIEKDLEAEVAKRRDFLMKRLDKKLGSAVAAYIVECLGQGADLGAQREYVLKTLEQNKEAFKQELGS
jgi:hypothetical protein